MTVNSTQRKPVVMKAVTNLRVFFLPKWGPFSPYHASRVSVCCPLQIVVFPANYIPEIFHLDRYIGPTQVCRNFSRRFPNHVAIVFAHQVVIVVILFLVRHFVPAIRGLCLT